jgi:hypothetical protein
MDIYPYNIGVFYFLPCNVNKFVLLVSRLFYRCGRKKVTVTSAKMHCHVIKKLTLLRWIDLVQHYWGTFFCLLDWFSLYLVEENGVILIQLFEKFWKTKNKFIFSFILHCPVKLLLLNKCSSISSTWNTNHN